VRQLLGEIFGIPLNKVNVKRIAVGGSFGSSIQMNSVVPIGVALALKARRPVKLASTREEDMYSHCKYPSIIQLKLGARKDGSLTAGQMKIIVDIGAHNTQAYPLLGCMAGWWVSLYNLPISTLRERQSTRIRSLPVQCRGLEILRLRLLSSL